MIDAGLDLLLGSRCSVCAGPGRALCRGCALALPARASPSWPTPTPPGLARPWSTGEYVAALRALVVDHKERNRLALARPLGRLLAVAADAAWRGEHGAAPFVAHLVPVPSHPSVVRRRGQDPLLRLTREAAAELRRRGADVTVLPALTVVARPGDQAGLGAADRASNVAGRFRVPGRVARGRGSPGHRGPPRRPVLLVDDVITTGATLREAQRALEAAGLGPFAAATVAATRRRHPGADPGIPPAPGYPADHRGTSV